MFPFFGRNPFLFCPQKLCATLAVASLSLLIAGCGGGSDGTSSSSASSQASFQSSSQGSSQGSSSSSSQQSSSSSSSMQSSTSSTSSQQSSSSSSSVQSSASSSSSQSSQSSSSASSGVVQVDISSLLDTRAVATLTNGALAYASTPGGIDGYGAAFLTAAASAFNNDSGSPVTLPDDGVFAATTVHPRVVLHFANTAPASSFQAHTESYGSSSFTFNVPAGAYSQAYLFFTSSQGSAALTIRLSYSDTTTETFSRTAPDYGSTIDGSDPNVFNLAANLPKWYVADKVEADRHFIHGLIVPVQAAKTLTGIRVSKLDSGHLLFWGATLKP